MSWGRQVDGERWQKPPWYWVIRGEGGGATVVVVWRVWEVKRGLTCFYNKRVVG